MGITYKDSGVDISAGDETVRRIKPLVRSTFNEKVLTDIGLFGGFYDGTFPEYEHPVLVASTDGVGTKLKIAFASGIHNSVGHCLVNHCTDDILSCGAKPLFFLDYFAVGKLNPVIAEKVIEGFVEGCKENSCALIGGETAEMPSMYSMGEYDISGTIVGVVDKKNIVDGKRIIAGDIMIGLQSSGLHTNGYSLARKVLLNNYQINNVVEELGQTIGEALLAIHKSYLSAVYPLIEKKILNGISHITGGGIVGNTSRIIPEGLDMNIDWKSWSEPAIFSLIRKIGNIDENEMRHVFNLGIGMILIVDKNKVNTVLEHCRKERPVVIGEIVRK
ncbi:MAG: phosphoribosylformylglycinamidine cyclo-ligase [bacterium]